MAKNITEKNVKFRYNLMTIITYVIFFAIFHILII